MLIQIAAKEFDLSGFMTINTVLDNSKGEMTRRVNRAATLDGGAVITDRGFTHADRTMTFFYEPVSEDHDNIARRIMELHQRVYISTHEGYFEAAPVSFEPAAEKNSFTFYIIDKVNGD